MLLLFSEVVVVFLVVFGCGVEGSGLLFDSLSTAVLSQGVADGVGGWRNYGVDPSLFSSSLMATCRNAVVEGRSRPDAPKTIIATGYRDLIQRTRTSFPAGRG